MKRPELERAIGSVNISFACRFYGTDDTLQNMNSYWLFFIFHLKFCDPLSATSIEEGSFENSNPNFSFTGSSAQHRTYVHGESSLLPITSQTLKHTHLSSEVAPWIRNTSFLLFSNHGGIVKDTAQELLNAGVPRASIHCVGVAYYANVLQPEHALDGDLCTAPPWAGAVAAFFGRVFPRRQANFRRDTRMYWTLLESPDDLRAFAGRFCPAVAAFDVVWVDMPSIFAVMVAPCLRGGSGGGRPRLVVRLGHRSHLSPSTQKSIYI